MADITPESVADMKSECLAGLLRNTHRYLAGHDVGPHSVRWNTSGAAVLSKLDRLLEPYVRLKTWGAANAQPCTGICGVETCVKAKQ
jgi:hypothetical protein